MAWSWRKVDRITDKETNGYMLVTEDHRRSGNKGERRHEGGNQISGLHTWVGGMASSELP